MFVNSANTLKLITEIKMTAIYLAKIKNLINQIPNDLIVEDIKIFPYHIEVKITGKVNLEAAIKEFNPSLDPFDHPSSQQDTKTSSDKVLDDPTKDCYKDIRLP